MYSKILELAAKPGIKYMCILLFIALNEIKHSQSFD